MRTKKKFKILLIGCGNIGSRYFEAINKLNLNIELFLFDKNFKRSANLLNLPSNKTLVRKINNLAYFRKDLDLLIISTNSDVRVKILINILKKVKVKKVILEKVLCQSLKDLNLLIALNNFYNLI